MNHFAIHADAECLALFTADANGMVHGGGYVGGLIKGVTFGMRAAEHICKSVTH